MDMYRTVAVCLVIFASYINGTRGDCQIHRGESPAINLCESNSRTVSAGSFIYLDSSAGAPEFTKIECTCKIAFMGAGTVDLTYRRHHDAPANESDCGVEFSISNTNWGCESRNFTEQLQGSTNLTYIKKFNETADWYSCLGIRSNFYNIVFTCYRWEYYFAPGEVVDGSFGYWSDWSDCSATCGTAAHQTKVRRCNRPAPRNGGAECVAINGTRTLEETQTRDCNLTDCTEPVDGGFTDWSQWTICTITCNGGSRNRTRSCTNPTPQNGGQTCSGNITETEQCNTNACQEPVDGGFTDWSQWTACTGTCNGGSRSRTRSCTNPTPQNGGQTCSDYTTETEQCNTNACQEPVDGGLTNWSQWTICTVTCNGGSRNRTRSCTNPTPQNGGLTCNGNTIETEQCSTNACPVNGGWSGWSSWSSCSQSCGGSGIQMRTRTCDNPEPVNGGSECTGSPSENITCGQVNCPVDGSWSNWLAWNTCSKSCGDDGFQTRSRTCGSPAPQYGGAYCVGDSLGVQKCGETVECPINGHWGVWSSWSQCSQTCGYGIQTRNRSCDNPSPQYGGQICTGNNIDKNVCYVNDCPVDGQWSQWSQWSSCSVTCANGTHSRYRQCYYPAPQNNGLDCSGNSTESGICIQNPCQRNGNWGLWSPWSLCVITCGSGTISRIRECNNPEPSDGGNVCKGQESDNKNCFKSPCPIDGKVGPWSPWSVCSASCGVGERSRTRFCNNPSPSNGGENCSDILMHTAGCNIITCQESSTGTSQSTSGEASVTEASVAQASSDVGMIVGIVIACLALLILLVLLIICLVTRRRRKKPDDKRRPSTGPRSVRYFSQGDDVTVTENELYHYDGENPSHATNALFVGGIPETPSSPGHIPHFSTDTGDRYAVIIDSNRTKPKSKERPKLDTFKSQEGNKEANGDVRASTDTVKLAENYNEDPLGRGVENPAYDENYIAPYDSTDGETKPKSSSASSPSPYDYIDHEKLKKDDEAFESENLAGDYATVPDDTDTPNEAEENDRYKRFISSDAEVSPDDGYMKSPKRDKSFEFPDTN